MNSGLVKEEFNEYAVDEYLGNRYVREPYTFFRNIYQLPAGCCLKVDFRLQVQIKKYWDLPASFNMSESCAGEQIYEAFKEQVYHSIYRRMAADVPIGTYLSGGIDSGIISAVCAKKAGQPVHTYTVGFPELNEFDYAGRVAEKYHTVHHEIRIRDFDYFDKLEEMISFKDAPLGVPNEIPLAIMSKELKKSITVVLSGEGADELVEFAYREVPWSLKLKWNSEEARKKAVECEAAAYSEILDTPKYLLRRLGSELLPEEIVTGRKVGFPVPLDRWFARLEKMAYDLLGSARWMAAGKLGELIAGCKENARPGQLLWMFINIELFRSMYFEKRWEY